MTASRLSGLLDMIEQAESRKGPAPTELSELVRWLAMFDGVDRYPDLPLHIAIDLEGDRIVDDWGQTVVVIAVEGSVWALASPGANGTWEDGRGDDIVVVRQPTGRAKWLQPE
ncbi:MAG: hypothetical protein WD294_04020 [Phycisphaeraceae bacterium]